MPRTGSRDYAVKKAQCEAWTGKPSGREAAARLEKSRLKVGEGCAILEKGQKKGKSPAWYQQVPGKQAQKKRQQRADLTEKPRKTSGQDMSGLEQVS